MQSSMIERSDSVLEAEKGKVESIPLESRFLCGYYLWLLGLGLATSRASTGCIGWPMRELHFRLCVSSAATTTCTTTTFRGKIIFGDVAMIFHILRYFFLIECFMALKCD